VALSQFVRSVWERDARDRETGWDRGAGSRIYRCRRSLRFGTCPGGVALHFGHFGYLRLAAAENATVEKPRADLSGYLCRAREGPLGTVMIRVSTGHYVVLRAECSAHDRVEAADVDS
jgi:hypothetical protein